MNQHNRMLQEKPGITAVIEGYTVAYYAMEYYNDSIVKLKEEFASYAAHQIQTDSTVSALSK